MDKLQKDKVRIAKMKSLVRDQMPGFADRFFNANIGVKKPSTLEAVYWWCYMHSPEPLSSAELLEAMPTDKSIAAIYQRMNEKQRLEKSLSFWGDAIVWSDFHKVDKNYNEWD